MPRMDGLETCRLREHDELKDTMIVFLTALGEDEHQLTGFAAGADDYISKPIKMHILVSRLKAILKRIGAGDAAPAIRAASRSIRPVTSSNATGRRSPCRARSSRC